MSRFDEKVAQLGREGGVGVDVSAVIHDATARGSDSGDNRLPANDPRNRASPGS